MSSEQLLKCDEKDLLDTSAKMSSTKIIEKLVFHEFEDELSVLKESYTDLMLPHERVACMRCTSISRNFQEFQNHWMVCPNNNNSVSFLETNKKHIDSLRCSFVSLSSLSSYSFKSLRYLANCVAESKKSKSKTFLKRLLPERGLLALAVGQEDADAILDCIKKISTNQNSGSSQLSSEKDEFVNFDYKQFENLYEGKLNVLERNLIRANKANLALETIKKSWQLPIKTNYGINKALIGTSTINKLTKPTPDDNDDKVLQLNQWPMEVSIEKKPITSKIHASKIKTADVPPLDNSVKISKSKTKVELIKDLYAESSFNLLHLFMKPNDQVSLPLIKQGPKTNKDLNKRIEQLPEVLYISEHVVSYKPNNLIAKNNPVLSRKQLSSTVCEKCLKKDKNGLKVCSGSCFRAFHVQCLSSPSTSDVLCSECKNDTHTCFYCQKPKSSQKPLTKCSHSKCGRRFHTSCRETRRNALFITFSRYLDDCVYDFKSEVCTGLSTCLTHICMTCLSKSKEKKLTKKPSVALSSTKLQCIKCPASYHNCFKCLPAGCQLLQSNKIVCQTHITFKSATNHQAVHLTRCYVCNTGGKLLYCDRCPASAHSSCVVTGKRLKLDGIKSDKEEWLCRNCSLYRTPMYGSVLWTKSGYYRWWPAVVIYPQNIPQHLSYIKSEVGEFPVRLLGTNKFVWMNIRRSFPFVDDFRSKVRSKPKTALENALLEADKLINQTRNKEPVETFEYITKVQSYNGVELPQSIACYERECGCSSSFLNPCGIDSSCLNKWSLTECEICCVGGSRCGNRNFMNPTFPDYLIRCFNDKGWGVVANENIREGTFIGEYVGDIVDHQEMEKRKAKQQKNAKFYYFHIINQVYVDAGPRGNHTRFINHSCDANCSTEVWSVYGKCRIGIYSKRYITRGEELTFDYNLDTNKSFGPFSCMCGSQNCLSDKKQMEKQAGKNIKKQKKRFANNSDVTSK